MKRPKYHFLQLETTSYGTSFFALPGQTFGRSPVPTRTLVKEKGVKGMLRKARQNAKPGDLFFTTTLAPAAHTLTASDIYPLNENLPVFFADAQDEYEKYLHNHAS